MANAGHAPRPTGRGSPPRRPASTPERVCDGGRTIVDQSRSRVEGRDLARFGASRWVSGNRARQADGPEGGSSCSQDLGLPGRCHGISISINLDRLALSTAATTMCSQARMRDQLVVLRTIIPIALALRFC